MHELKQLLIALIAILVLFAFARAIGQFVSDWRAKRRAIATRAADVEAEGLCQDISTLSPVKLTTEYLPQQFPSKAAAQSFGEKWSLGGPDSFKAKDIDSQGRDEDHPHFDKSSISAGILYTYPALFFGMKDAHRDDDEWFLSFVLARNQWLRSYLTHLKQ